jgi:hypothetical protein
MKRYSELMVGDNKLTDHREITKILIEKKLTWLVDSEVEGAKIEIKNDTLIWHSGNFYSGQWRYGIFRAGSFYGTWHSGIFESGNFEGSWIGGIRLDQK